VFSWSVICPNLISSSDESPTPLLADATNICVNKI
jgi:hypothetical protein